MKNNFDIIVVGGGAAGLTSAAYSSKEKSVLVLEKENSFGGLVGSFERDGFVFDSGIRAFENSGIIFPMLKELGIEMEFSPNIVSIGISDKIVRLENKESLYEYESMLNELFQEEKNSIGEIIKLIEKIMDDMDVLYGIDNPLFIDYINDKEYLYHVLLPWMFKYIIRIRNIKKYNQPINDFLERITPNKPFVDAITQHFFTDTPTFFALSYFSLYLDYFYPKGGTVTLVNKLVDYCRKNNVCLENNSNVDDVDIINKTLTSNGIVYKYKSLIWCCDMKTLYDLVLKNEIKENKLFKNVLKQSKLIENNKGGNSVFSLYLEIDLNKEYFDEICGAHMFYTPSLKGLRSLGNINYDSVEEIKEWLSDYIKLTTFEISCPVLRDPDLAPENKTGLIVSTLLDYNVFKHSVQINKYQEIKEFCEDEIIKTLEKNLLPEINGKIMNKFSATPITLEKYTGNINGAITGWSFESEKLPAEERFIKIKNSIFTSMPNVYQAGQWTFSPSGLPVSILTGKMAAVEAVKSLRRTK